MTLPMDGTGHMSSLNARCSSSTVGKLKSANQGLKALGFYVLLVK